jgi:hypothetical protein
MRTFLQRNWKDLPGERGLIFPFDLAGTNNPWNYRFTSKNNWKTYKSTLDRPDSLDYGLLGMVLETKDSLINIDFRYKRTIVKPHFDRIRMYHNKGTFPFEISLGKDDSIILRIQTNEEIGYTDIHLKKNISLFKLHLSHSI